MPQIRSDYLSYPVIVLFEHGFQVWRDSRSLMLARARIGRGAGVLVDRDGRAYKVIRVECETLVYEDEPFSVPVDKLREKIVWLVSARGHFESPTGFGLPGCVATASTVSELLEGLGESLNS